MRSRYLAAFLPFLLAIPSGGGQCQEATKPAQKAVIYDESADATKQIAAALAKAKRNHQHVLLQWGGNWCHWCHLLHATMAADAELSKELLYEFQVVLVDAGGKDQKNLDLAKSYGADLRSFGFPFLTILGADGKPIANQETAALEKKGADGQSLGGKDAGHEAKKVLAFLKSHEAAPLKADAVLAAAMQEAQTSGRRIFLHFGAPWCGWCHKLEDWLASDAIAPLIAKDFVDLKIDQDRMLGAKEIEARFGMLANSGIPWFAIVDPGTGTSLANSTGPSGNIGYPVEADEIQHFMAMLESTHQHLSAAELGVLRESLTSAGKALNTGR